MKDLDKRFKRALEIDPDCLCPVDKVREHRGRSMFEMERLGFTKKDMKWLERKGLAIRGYTYNGQIEYSPDGRTNRNFMDGCKLKWILLLPQQTETKDASI